MKKCFLALYPLLSVALFGSPGLAETSAEEVAEQMRATNVQRLILINECFRCDLAGVDLSGAHLIGADLRETTLVGANLSWSNLEGADLTQADLTDANLTGAFLTNASLAYANLDNVNFAQAQLYYVDVTGASMENLNLADATLIGTPISIGGDMDQTDAADPVLVPDDSWQLQPPGEPWFEPWQNPGEILDVPPLLVPQV